MKKKPEDKNLQAFLNENYQSPVASQGANILLTEQIHKGGVPLFEERGTALIYIYLLILSFKRAYK
jgi:hypothetical protein